MKNVLIRQRRILISAIIILMMSSCELIDVHPYDGKIDGEKDLNRKNIEMIEGRTAGRALIRFAVISDTQRWYDETEKEVASINGRSDIDFVIHCGDQSDFGVTKEFEWQRRILKKLKVPYVMILGNHDCIGSGKEVFRAMYGRENFSFVAGPTRFVCLDTNALEYDFSNPVPDLNFVRSYDSKLEVNGNVKNTVPVMHVCPFADEFNDNVADAFNYYIHNLTNPVFCLYGHGHQTKVDDLFGDGLLYYQITCAKHRQYYVFTVTEEGYDYETVDY